MADLSSLATILVEIARPALRVLLRTVAGTAVLTTVTAFGCWRLVAQGPWWSGLLAALLPILLGLVVGAILAVKLPIARAISHGIEQFGLGRRVARLVFDQIEGTAPARFAERLPCVEAERLLRAAIGVSRRRDLSTRNWFSRLILGRMLDAIETMTLARFREEGKASGGIAPKIAFQAIGETIDANLAGMVRQQANRLAVGLSAAALGVSLLGALLLRNFAMVP